MTILCLGEALIDLVPPPGFGPGNAASLLIQPGGAPLNIAIGLARLGVSSLFLGRLSSDAFGQRLDTLLEAEGVERFPQDMVDNPTRLAVVDHLNTASPFRFYGEATADSTLSTEHIAAVMRNLRPRGLYVGSLMMTNDNARTVQSYALAEARRLGIPVFSDSNPRPSAWPSREIMLAATEQLLSASTVAKLSLDDARALGWPDAAEALLRWGATRFATQLFITAGAAGCWTLAGDDMIHVAARPIDPVDPTGAGDASFAALIARFVHTGVIRAAELAFAAAAGALATQKHGAVSGLPTLAEVEAKMEDDD